MGDFPILSVSAKESLPTTSDTVTGKGVWGSLPCKVVLREREERAKNYVHQPRGSDPELQAQI